MPRYPWLLKNTINFDEIRGRVDSMALLGVPYGDLLNEGKTVESAKAQALEIAIELEEQGGPDAMETYNKKVIALIAYLQRMGVDISKTPPPDEETPQVEAHEEVSP